MPFRDSDAHSAELCCYCADSYMADARSLPTDGSVRLGTTVGARPLCRHTSTARDLPTVDRRCMPSRHPGSVSTRVLAIDGSTPHAWICRTRQANTPQDRSAPEARTHRGLTLRDCAPRPPRTAASEGSCLEPGPVNQRRGLLSTHPHRFNECGSPINPRYGSACPTSPSTGRTPTGSTGPPPTPNTNRSHQLSTSTQQPRNSPDSADHTYFRQNGPTCGQRHTNGT